MIQHFKIGTPFTLKWFGRSGIIHRTDTVQRVTPEGIVHGEFFIAHHTNCRVISKSKTTSGNTIAKKLMPTIFCMLMLFSLPAIAQVTFGLGFGVNSEKTVNPNMQVALGFQKEKIHTSAIMQNVINRRADVPYFYGLTAGYEFLRNVIISPGIYITGRASDQLPGTSIVPGANLQCKKQMSDYGQIFCQAYYINNSTGIIAGIAYIF